MASKPLAEGEPLTAFVSFPSPYTQSLLERAIASTLPAVHLTSEPPAEDDPPRLQWADYDLMTFDKPHATPKYLISSYVYRKALIRKHQLHATVLEYLAKMEHRGQTSVLAQPKDGGVGGMPKGWILDIQFADELDELLMDDLYDLSETLRRNEEEVGEKQWFILKPGFADRAQGIRMFSTEDQLREIFEEFEPASDDEEEDDDDEDEDEQDEDLAERVKKASLDDEDEDQDEAAGTGVMTSHLRHFVIQEYLPRPVLFDLGENPDFPNTELVGQKADAYGAPIQEDDLVRLFWDLEGCTALASKGDGYEARGKVTRAWLEATFAKAGEVVAETVRAGAECGSFGLQLMPNAFEIFGVDLLVSYPPSAGSGDLPIPDVTLLEFNASPDFIQSGDALRPKLLDMFKGVIRLSVAPYFGIKLDDEEEKEMSVGEERYGWRLVGQGEVRGNWA